MSGLGFRGSGFRGPHLLDASFWLFTQSGWSCLQVPGVRV